MSSPNRKEEDKGYLQFAELDSIKKKILINGQKRNAISLPERVTAENIEDCLYAGCQKYNLDYVSEDNIKKWAVEVNKQYYREELKKTHKNANEKESFAAAAKTIKGQEIYLPMYNGNGSIGGTIGLIEAFLLSGKPYFLWTDKKDSGNVFINNIAEEIGLADGRILKPLTKNEYLTKPYEFTTREELQQYIEKARNETLDTLFEKVVSICDKYIVAYDRSHIYLLAADIVYSYFQDKPKLTHYLFFVGDNDSGKSTNLRLIHELGYRNLVEAYTTAANIYRVLGNEVEGQATICEDEADGIDQDKEKMRIYKSGYTGGIPITRSDPVNNNGGIRKTIKWNTFCFKAYAAEKLPDAQIAKGFNERCIVIQCYKGEPKYDLAEVLNPTGIEEYQQLVNELIETRNTLWAYRLLHWHEKLPKVNLNIKSRERQLFGPLIRLFKGTETLNKYLLPTVSKYIGERRQEKVDSLHAFLYRLVRDLIKSQGTAELESALIWNTLKDILQGQEVPNKPLSYDSAEYGLLSQKEITQKLKEIFGAASTKHGGKAGTTRSLVFNLEKLQKAGKTYELDVDVKVTEEEGGGTEEVEKVADGIHVGLDTHIFKQDDTNNALADRADEAHSEGIPDREEKISDKDSLNNKQQVNENIDNVKDKSQNSTIHDEVQDSSPSDTSATSAPSAPKEEEREQDGDQQQLIIQCPKPGCSHNAKTTQEIIKHSIRSHKGFPIVAAIEEQAASATITTADSTAAEREGRGE